MPDRASAAHRSTSHGSTSHGSTSHGSTFHGSTSHGSTARRGTAHRAATLDRGLTAGVGAADRVPADRAPADRAPADRTPQRRGVALALIVTCTLMLILDTTVMNVALPRIRSDLGFSATGLAWVMSGYTLSFGGLLLLGGRAGDILGRRRVFLAGIALFTVASLAGGLAPTAGWLLAARVAQGVGAAAAGPNTIALIATTFTDARERVRALALMSGVASMAFAAGLIVGGLLTQLGSWRWVLFINVPFGAVALALAPRFVREPARHPARLDLAGAVTATAGVAALVYALLHAAAAGWAGATTVVPLAAGLACVAAFLTVEARTAAPVLPLRLFADRNRAAGYANFFLGPAAMMSTFFFLTQFLQNLRGYSALTTGLAFLPMAAGMFVMTRLVPWLLGRSGPKPLAVAGSLLMVAGLLWLTRLHPETHYLTGILGPMAVLGVGGGLGFAPLNPVVMAEVPPADAGAAGGALQTMQQLGSTLGLSVLVTVYGSQLRVSTGSVSAGGVSTGGVSAGSVSAGAGPVATVHGMTTAFTVAAAIAAATVPIALTFRRARNAD